jgi:hypothetical protein
MRGAGGFPLLQRLRVAQSVGSSGSVRVYSGSAIGIDTDKLAYFGVSVVWWAAAHEWKNLYSDHEPYSIDVGCFMEPMRQYLFGIAQFPTNVAVNVQVATDHRSQCSAYTPALAAGTPCKVFGFLTCGIHFAVSMGMPLPQQYSETCCYSSRDQLIFEKDLSGQSARAFNRLYATTRVAGALARAARN